MGSRSGSDDLSKRRHKRKKKKASSSRSRSRSYEGRSTTKHKKSSKQKRAVRSRSRSRDRKRSRSRSSSKRRSVSRDRRRRSRSLPSGRRRSASRERKKSRSSSSSRKRSPNRERRRSRSRSWKRSRSRSYSRSPKRQRSPTKKAETRSPVEEDFELPAGFSEMTPAEQNKARMQLAIGKAMALDEGLRQNQPAASQTSAAFTLTLTSEEAEKRRKQIEEIESDRFKRRAFKSGVNNNKAKKPQDVEAVAHDEAMFGSVADPEQSNASATPVTVNVYPTCFDNGLTHPLLFDDPDVRMNRWLAKLDKLRKENRAGGSIAVPTM